MRTVSQLEEAVAAETKRLADAVSIFLLTWVMTS
jgi:hypothetical protein